LATVGFTGVTAIDTRVGGAIAIENVCACDAYPDDVSVTVTAKLNGLPVAVLGVPPIAPVDAFSVSPGGSAPGGTDHCRVPGFPPTSPMVALYSAPTMPFGSVAGVT
jgi:hypothetical protein